MGRTHHDTAAAETLPASWYRDPSIYEIERREIFSRQWLLLAHERELAAPGDCFAETLAGWPIFAVRGRDGAIRAFHNVCRHRAGPIVGEGASRCRVLRCRYHGWVYDDHGALERTPDFGEADGFERADHPLFALSVSTWRGFVFVNLQPQAPPLEQALGRLPDLAADLPLESLQWSGERISHPIRCNWKTYVENYLEGYHVPYLHPALNKEIALKDYRIEAAERVVTHHVPSRRSANAPVYRGLWAWLHPNVAFNFYGRGLSVERMLPSGPGAMRLEYLFLFAEDADDREREAAREMCGRVTREDQEICESVQRNLEAGVYHAGRLSPRHENGVRYFQDAIRGCIDAPHGDAPAGHPMRSHPIRESE